MYYVLKNSRDQKNVYVTQEPDFDDWDVINEGTSLVDEWPEGLTLQYSEDRPEGVILTDYITNALNWLIASEKFKHSLEKLNLDYFEFLPVGFLDHKGRTRKEPYWIVNFLKLFPGVNREQSVCEDTIGGTLGFFEKLTLTEEIEKNGPPIFCLKEQPKMVLFRQDYKEKIDALGLTGFRLVPTDEFKTLD